MRFSTVLPAALILFAVGANAEAPKSVCIDTHRSYEAHTLGLHDIVIRSTMGKPRPALRLSTTCTALEKADVVSVNSTFGCVGMGDTVVATKIDGHRQLCRVSRVAPYAPSEAPAQP